MPTAVSDEVLPSEMLPSDMTSDEKLPSDGGFDLSHVKVGQLVNQPSAFSSGSIMPGPEDTGLIRAVGAPIQREVSQAWETLNKPINEFFPETPQQRFQRNMREISLAQQVSPQADVGPNAAPINPAVAGTLSGVGSLAKGFTSPIGLATLGIASLPSVAQRAVSLAFAAQMASQTPEIAHQLGTEFGKPENERDNAKIANLLTQAGGTAFMTSAAGLHGITGGFQAPAEEVVQPALQEAPPANEIATPADLKGMQANVLPSEAKTPAETSSASVPTAGEQAKANLPPAAQTIPEVAQPVNAPVVRTPDGQIDQVATAIARMTQKPTVADVAAANPDKPVTMGDLAQLAQELKQSMTFNPENRPMGEKPILAPTAPETSANIEPGEQASASLPEKADALNRVLYTLASTGDYADEVGLTLDNYVENGTFTPIEARAIEAKIKSGQIKSELSPDEFREFIKNPMAWKSEPEATLEVSPKTEVARPGDASEETRAEQPSQTGNPVGGQPTEPTVHTESTPVKVGEGEPSTETVIQNAKYSIAKLPEKRSKLLQNAMGEGTPRLPGFDRIQKQLDYEDANALNMTEDEWRNKITFQTPNTNLRWGHPEERPVTRQEAKYINLMREKVLQNNVWRDYPMEWPELQPGDLPTQDQAEQFGAGNWHKYRMADYDILRKQSEAQIQKPKAVPEKPTEQFQASAHDDLFSQKAAALADKLEVLKTGVAKGGQLHAFGVAADLWDRAVEAAQKAIRAGGSVADAIEAAIQHIRDNFNGKFQEKEARAELQKQLGNETAAPKRGVEQVKSEFAKAQSDLERKTSELTDTTKGTQFDRQQAANKAAAKYRILRDELKEHPDYVAEQLGKQHAAISEANELLKPLGKSINPEEMPDQAELRQKLSPDQFKRYQELASQISEATTEIQKMAPALVSRVMNEMQADGRLPKGKQIIPEAGRTLDKLSQFLRNNDFDSPKKTFAERLALGQRFADTVSKLKDAVTKSIVKAQAGWRAMVDALKNPPKENDYKNVKRQWVGYDQRTGVENYQLAKDLNRRVPNLDRQKAISLWMDADGDEGTLRYQRDSVPEAYRKPFELALKLTDGEKRLALEIKDNWAQKAEDAMNAGLMNRARENYGVPQRWEKPPERGANPEGEPNKGSAGNPGAVLDTRDPFFSFQRKTPTYFDGIMAGGKPENLAIGHLVTVYDEAFHKALGSRGFISALQEAKAADGLPITKVSGKAYPVTNAEGKATLVNPKPGGPDMSTADGRPYRSVDHPAMKDWKFVSKDTNGNPIMLKGDMLVHPDHFDDVKNELETPRWMRRLMPGETRNMLESTGYYTLKAGSFLKASKFIGPFHNVTEASHATSHGFGGMLADVVHGDIGEAVKNRGTLSPSVRGFAIDLKDPKQALLGRNMVLGFGRAREMFEDGLSTQGGIWAHTPGLGDAVVKLNNFTFNEYIPRLKMKVGLAVLDRNMKRYGKELNPEQIAELTGRQMDAAFGGQNWRMMGANKNLLGVMRLAMVAPDFLISRSKVVGQAFTKYGAEQRYFLVAQAAGVYALSRVLNAVFSDNHDPHFEPKNWDSVVIGKRAYHARFIVSDAAALARDMLGLGYGQGVPFISGRLGYLPKTAIEAVTGKDLFTGQSKQLPIQASGAFKALETVAVDTAQWMTPMGVDGFLPGANARGQTGLGQVAASLVGVSSRKNDTAGDIYGLAARFNRNSSDPAAQRFQAERDNSQGAQSDYRTLDNLLDAGKLAEAKKAYDDLIASRHSQQAILSRYNRPEYFTGNRKRETEFQASLTPQQKALYQQAIQERQARAQALRQALAR